MLKNQFEISPAKIIRIWGLFTFFGGIILRLMAHYLTWPNNGYSFHGLPENTRWGIREWAYIDISYALMALGGLLILLVSAKCLWGSLSEN